MKYSDRAQGNEGGTGFPVSLTGAGTRRQGSEGRRWSSGSTDFHGESLGKLVQGAVSRTDDPSPSFVDTLLSDLS